MIEVNWTFFLQLANFLVLVYLLNRFLFKPIMENVEKRDEKLKALSEETAILNEKADKLLENYEKSLEETKKMTHEMLHKARQDANAEQEKIIGKARAEFSVQVGKANEDIKKYAQTASEELKKEASAISKVMISKIVGEN